MKVAAEARPIGAGYLGRRPAIETECNYAFEFVFGRVGFKERFYGFAHQG